MLGLQVIRSDDGSTQQRRTSFQCWASIPEQTQIDYDEQVDVGLML